MTSDGTLDRRHSFYGTPPVILRRLDDAAARLGLVLTDRERARALDRWYSDGFATFEDALRGTVSDS